MMRALVFGLLLSCHAPEPAPARPPGAVAEVLRAAASIVEILPRDTKAACVTVTVVSAVLDASAAIVEAPAPTLPPIELDLRRCALEPAEIDDEEVVATVAAVIDVARAGLALSRAAEAHPKAAAAADAALAYARDLVPQLIELAAGEIGSLTVPPRSLGW